MLESSRSKSVEDRPMTATPNLSRRLRGKCGLITGATGNIGRAAALLCLQEGASLLLVDRDEDELTRVRASLQKSVPSASVACIAADVTHASSVRGFTADAVNILGKLDLVFVNAGIEGPVSPARDYPDDGFDAVMAVNCTGAFNCLKQAIHHLQDGGSIVLTSSVMGLSGGANTIGYTASKHAVVGLMRSAAKNVAARRIRVNTVHPGFVESDMLRRIEAELSAHGVVDPRAAALAATPMGECVAPHDIACAVAFLFSDDSRFVTGQTLAVDGGYLL
jgi:NAD(P)-dependent dehydrogenase (short-subunit alcohol dehydrogenase family)